MLTRVTRKNNINYLNCVPSKLGFWWSNVSFTPAGPLSDRLSNSLHTFAFLFAWFLQHMYIWAKTGCNRDKDQRRNVLKMVMLDNKKVALRTIRPPWKVNIEMDLSRKCESAWCCDKLQDDIQSCAIWRCQWVGLTVTASIGLLQIVTNCLGIVSTTKINP